MAAMLLKLLAASLWLATPAFAVRPAAPRASRVGTPARFAVFFAALRKAVLAGDRAAVAKMTHFPFVDSRAGRSCEARDEGCRVEADSLDRQSRAAFSAGYDRLFTLARIAAIRAGRVRAASSGVEGEIVRSIGSVRSRGVGPGAWPRIPATAGVS